jgi:hypothetical protein
MMLAFEIDIQIVKWVMTALGRPWPRSLPHPLRPWFQERSGARTDWTGTFRPTASPAHGHRAAMALTEQATAFRKTRRTGKPACRLGWVGMAP